MTQMILPLTLNVNLKSKYILFTTKIFFKNFIKHLHLLTKLYISKENSTNNSLLHMFITGYTNIHGNNCLFLSSCIHMQYNNKVENSVKKDSNRHVYLYAM